MKKTIFILLIIFVGLLGYSFYKDNEQKKENQWLHSQYYKENPEIHFEDNIEDSAKKIIEKTKEESKKLVDETKKVADNFTKKTNDIACCRTGAVVPNPVYSYGYVESSSCEIPCEMVNHNGEVFESCATGTSYSIVDNSYCESVTAKEKIDKNSCVSSTGRTMSYEQAFAIAKDSLCSFDGEISSEYSCEIKDNGVDVLSIIINAEPTIFDDPSDVCITTCQVSINDEKVSVSKKCN